MRKDDGLELMSEEVQEMLGKIPPKIITWSTFLVIVLTVGVFIASYLIKYPDVIVSSIVLNSETSSAQVVSHTSGRIQKLFVKDNQQVKANDILGIIENTANCQDIFAVKKIIQSASNGINSQIFFEVEFPNNLELGTVQESFSVFHKLYFDYRTMINLDQYENKISTLTIKRTDFNNYVKSLEAQLFNNNRILQLNKNNYRRDSILFAKKLISAREFESIEQTILKAGNNYESIKAAVQDARIKINQLKSDMIDLTSQKQEKYNNMISSLKEAYLNLRYSIAQWEKEYLLISPIDGRVTFNNYWTMNQNVKQGDVVCIIVPVKYQAILGRIKLPVSGSGKVKKGQKIIIKLSNFPYTEFGIIEGRVESISLAPENYGQEKFYSVNVSLPFGLHTNLTNELPFSEDLQGSADIITNNISVFERFLNSLFPHFY